MCAIAYVDKEGLAIEQVGELVEGLVHDGPAVFRDIQFACDHDVLGPVFRRQKENSVRVRLIVQEWNTSLTQIIGVVFHLNHQI